MVLQLRKQRKVELEAHVESVNAMLRQAAAGEDGDVGGGAEEDGAEATDEWAGIEEPAEAEVNREDEYIDEDRYTTVTVEAVDIDREGIHTGETADAKSEDGGGDGEKGKAPADGAGETKKRIWTKERPKGLSKPKKKKQKFRYESKAERKFTRSKQSEKNREQAKARRDG